MLPFEGKGRAAFGTTRWLGTSGTDPRTDTFPSDQVFCRDKGGASLPRARLDSVCLASFHNDCLPVM